MLTQKQFAYKNPNSRGNKTHVAVAGHDRSAILAVYIIAICLAIIALSAGVLFKNAVNTISLNTTPTVSEDQSVASSGNNNSVTPPSKSMSVSGGAAKKVVNLPSSQEMQQTLNRWQAAYPGTAHGVVVQELESPYGYASLNADKSFQLASIYKLYLSYYLYNQLENKLLNSTATLGADHPVNTCIQLMLVYSNNACGESIGYFIGWPKLSYWMNDRGYTETSLTLPFETTAKDTAKILENLQSGKLINSADTKEMLDYMRQQIYRNGVPAGVPGIPVADRVGIARGYWNDAAIVYNKKGTYILVALTKDSGPLPIKDLSSRINSLFAAKR